MVCEPFVPSPCAIMPVLAHVLLQQFLDYPKQPQVGCATYRQATELVINVVCRDNPAAPHRNPLPPPRLGHL